MFFAVKGASRCSVVWRDLFGRLFLFCYDAFFAFAAFANGSGGGLIPDALGAAVGLLGILFPAEVDPFARVVALGDCEVGVDFPVVFRVERFDLTLALGEDGEGGGLHAASGGDIEAAVA